MHQLLTSLRRFVASLRPIAAVSPSAWVSHREWPVRLCPLIPRGHLSMCPHWAASLFTLNSSRRFSPVAYRDAGASHDPQLRALQNYRINVDRASGRSPQKQDRRRFQIRISSDRHLGLRQRSASLGRGSSRWEVGLPAPCT
jgi:hypothetical protein